VNAPESAFGGIANGEDLDDVIAHLKD